MKQNQNWGVEESDDTEDVFTPWPEDWDYFTDDKEIDVRTFIIDIYLL